MNIDQFTEEELTILCSDKAQVICMSLLKEYFGNKLCFPMCLNIFSASIVFLLTEFSPKTNTLERKIELIEILFDQVKETITSLHGKDMNNG